MEEASWAWKIYSFRMALIARFIWVIAKKFLILHFQESQIYVKSTTASFCVCLNVISAITYVGKLKWNLEFAVRIIAQTFMVFGHNCAVCKQTGIAVKCNKKFPVFVGTKKVFSVVIKQRNNLSPSQIPNHNQATLFPVVNCSSV